MTGKRTLFIYRDESESFRLSLKVSGKCQRYQMGKPIGKTKVRGKCQRYQDGEANWQRASGEDKEK